MNERKYNLNPITKLLVTSLLGMTVLWNIPIYIEVFLMLILTLMFIINNKKIVAIKHLGIFLLLISASLLGNDIYLPLAIKLIISILLVARMFYLPYVSAKFLIQTSSVGSIISSMDYLYIPSKISIPIAVMFRFFPSFMEEKKHIQNTMKIKGIETKNPLKYMEYILVPLLIISANIGEDIAKAAETKCIGRKGKKIRYKEVKIKAIDYLYACTIFLVTIGGKLWYQ